MKALLLMLLAADSLPFMPGQAVCDPAIPTQCAAVSASGAVKTDPSGQTLTVGGVVVIDGGYVDLIDRAGRLVGHVTVDSLPAVIDVIDGGSLSISNFPPIQPVSGSVGVNNLPRTGAGS